MAIATVLRGFNDLGHSVTPTFVSKKHAFIYNDLHIVQKCTKTERGKLKHFQNFCHGTSNPAATFDCRVRETMVAKFELVL